jgi:hypothetical protein
MHKICKGYIYTGKQHRSCNYQVIFNRWCTYYSTEYDKNNFKIKMSCIGQTLVSTSSIFYQTWGARNTQLWLYCEKERNRSPPLPFVHWSWVSSRDCTKAYIARVKKAKARWWINPSSYCSTDQYKKENTISNTPRIDEVLFCSPHLWMGSKPFYQM